MLPLGVSAPASHLGLWVDLTMNHWLWMMSFFSTVHTEQPLGVVAPSNSISKAWVDSNADEVPGFPHHEQYGHLNIVRAELHDHPGSQLPLISVHVAPHKKMSSGRLLERGMSRISDKFSRFSPVQDQNHRITRNKSWSWIWHFRW